MIMRYNVEKIEYWIRAQIAQPQADRIEPRSWFKYARETPHFSFLTKGDAPGFCRLAKIAGQRINEENNDIDIIKLHFPGIWAYSNKKWEKTGYSTIAA